MKEIIKQTALIVLGDKPTAYYLAGFFFSFLAILISLYQHSKSRNVSSPATPIPFNFWFLLWDNSKRIFIGMIVMFILFRLFDLSNPAAMIGVGFFIAFGLDKVIQYLRDYTDIGKYIKMRQ